MKLPSLFKIPKHQQFYFKPRYYDSIKEGTRKRSRLSSTESNKNNKKEEGASEVSGYSRLHYKNNNKDNTGIIRGGVALFLLIATISYGYIGKTALYIPVVLVFIVLIASWGKRVYKKKFFFIRDKKNK